MPTPAKANIKIKANGYWTQIWQIKNNSVPLDITDYDFKLDIKKARGKNVTSFLVLEVGSGITIVDALNGKIQLEINEQPMLVTTQDFVYDLIAIKNTKPYVWIEGTITFDPGVTYLEV